MTKPPTKPTGWARVEGLTFRQKVLAWFEDAETLTIEEAVSLGADRKAVLKTLQLMAKSSPLYPQQIYVSSWVRDTFGSVRCYPRPVYSRCDKPTPNKPRPAREPTEVTSRRWRERRAKRVNSVFEFASRFTRT